MSDTAEELHPRLLQLQDDLCGAVDRAHVLESFWAEMAARGTPLIEPANHNESRVTFLWRDDGTARHVAVLQDWGADGIREHHMARLPDSDVWHLTRRMRSDTRTTYQISPNTSDNPLDAGPYQLDPLNPQTYTAYLAEPGGNDILFSLLELPGASALPWRHYRSSMPGTVDLHQPFADGRRLWVYRSAADGYMPVLVLFDGRLYKDLLNLPAMLDYLLDEGLITPMTVVMVDNPDRNNELACNPQFADTIANEVLPWLRGHYQVSNHLRQTFVGGSSLGGLAATFLAFRHPGVFGAVLSQTGWYRWHPQHDAQHFWMARQLAAGSKRPIRFWLQVGNLEVAQMQDGGPSQLAANQHLRDTLQAKGYAVSYEEYSGGHDTSSLEAPLARGLINLLRSMQ